MGLWSDIAGGLAAVGGFVAAPFTGGLSIPAGLSAAGSIIGAGAVGDAASKQQDATNQALALQKQMYTQTRQDLSPYASLGTGAVGNLRFLAGIPNSPPGSVNGVAPQFQAGNGASPLQTGHVAPAGTPSAGVAVPRQVPMGTQSPAQMQTASGYVTMKAPDGTTAQVDQAHVQRAVQLGGQVVSS